MPDVPPALGSYSQVVRVPPGDIIFVSGQVSVDAKGRIVGKGDIGIQTEVVFQNLSACLATVGATMSDVAMLTIYCVGDWEPNLSRRVRERYFLGRWPAGTRVWVNRLADPDLLIEVDAIAVRTDGGR